MLMVILRQVLAVAEEGEGFQPVSGTQNKREDKNWALCQCILSSIMSVRVSNLRETQKLSLSAHLS